VFLLLGSLLVQPNDFSRAYGQPYALVVTADSTNRTYGMANPAFTGSLVGLQPGDNITASFASEAGAGRAAGTYPITISLADPDHKLGNYSVTTNNGTLTVEPATLTGTADNQSRPYGQPNPAFTVTYSGFVNGENDSIVTGTLVGSSYGKTSPVGIYPITVSGQSAPNYNIEYVPGVLSVTPAPLLVQANDANRAYGQANPVFTASYTGFVNGQDSNVLSGTLALSTTAATSSPVGTWPIAVSGVTSTNYSIRFSNGTLTIRAHELVVSADSTSRTYGSPNPAFTGSLAGLQPGDNITASFASEARAGSAVGIYPITISLADPGHKLGNYSVTTNNGTLTVEAATLTVTADNQSRSYGQPNPVFSVTYSGFVNGESPGIVTGTLVGSSPADANSPVGIYPITVSGQSAPNYTIQYGTGTLSVRPAPLLVQANDARRACGQPNPMFTASYTGFVNGEDSNVLSGTLALTTTADTNSPVGTYAIAAGGVASSNYSISFSDGTLTVAAYALVVITGLVEGTKYYFAATAVDAFGNESNYSDEISYEVPVPQLTVQEIACPDGQNVLDITGPAGRTYAVLSSSEQRPDTVLGISTIASDGTLEITLPPETFDLYPDYRLIELAIVPSPILQLSLTANGAVVLSATGQAGHAYIVLAAEAIPTSEWQVLGTIFSDSTGGLTFTDASATEQPACFYRLQDLTNAVSPPGV
jgi:hypothetical protein